MPKIYNGDLTKLFDLSGKKAVIFGGAGGFGQAIAEGYAANGCSVCISSRSEEKLQAAKAAIEKVAAPGVKVMYLAGDAGDEEFVKKAVDTVTGPDGLGGCDILVNSQGINKKMWSWEIETDFFEKMLVIILAEKSAVLHSLIIHHITLDGVFRKNGSGPLPKLDSPHRVDPISDGDDSIEAIEQPFALHLAITFGLNC